MPSSSTTPSRIDHKNRQNPGKNGQFSEKTLTLSFPYHRKIRKADSVETVEAEMTAVEKPTATEPGTEKATVAPLSGGEILLKGRYRLLREAPLPAYDSPTAKGYAVKDNLHPERPLFAHVCDSGLPLRWPFLEQQRQQNMRGVLQLVEEEVIEWPSEQGMCPVFIYMQPGEPLCSFPAGPMTVKAIEATVIAPAVEALRQLEALDLTHRGIRPDNLFMVENKEGAGVLLGDCVSAPSAYNQPVLFEPIESALADPAGRGRGKIADDVYALGVTVLALLLGDLPAKEVDKEAILKRKMLKGSYNFLMGKRPPTLPLRVMEFLKGTLHDDSQKRWGLDQIEDWLDERRTHELPGVPDIAPHVFTFRKEQHITGRSLACAFLQHPQEGAKAIRESRFESWAARSITSPDHARAVAEEILKDRAALASAERLVARIAILLDPEAPIRYKDFSASIDGFGSLLASRFSDDSTRRNFSEIIRYQLPQLWLSAQEPGVAKNRKILQRLHRLQHFLNRRGLGFGLERCLYELTPGLRCQSSLILPKYCADISELLPALEAAAGELEKLVEPIDSHIAAFVASRFPGKVDSFLVSLASSAGSAERALGILGMLASLQDRHGPARLTRLAGWVWKLLPPVIGSYHNQALRRRLEEEGEKIAGQGSLVAIYNLVGNPSQRRADQRAYAIARSQFTRSLAETARLDRKLKGLPLTSLVLGQMFAVRLCILIALVAVSLMISQYI